MIGIPWVESAVPPTAAVAAAAGSGVPDLWSAAVRVSAGLVLVLGLCLLVYAAWRRLPSPGRGMLGRGVAIRVVATRYVGSRTTLSVIEVEGRRFLVGVSPQGVRRLADLGRSRTADRGGGFARRLEEARHDA